MAAQPGGGDPTRHKWNTGGPGKALAVCVKRCRVRAALLLRVPWACCLLVLRVPFVHLPKGFPASELRSRVLHVWGLVVVWAPCRVAVGGARARSLGFSRGHTLTPLVSQVFAVATQLHMRCKH